MARWQKNLTPVMLAFYIATMLIFLTQCRESDTNFRASSSATRFATGDDSPQVNPSDVVTTWSGVVDSTGHKIAFKSIDATALSNYRDFLVLQFEQNTPFDVPGLTVGMNGFRAVHSGYIDLDRVGRWIQDGSGTWSLWIEIGGLSYHQKTFINRVNQILARGGQVRFYVESRLKVTLAQMVLSKEVGAAPSAPATAVMVLDRMPAKGSESRNVTFAFHGQGGETNFECQMDGGPVAPCASPVIFKHLQSGNHVFEGSAISFKGVPGPWVNWNFTVGDVDLVVTLNSIVPSNTPTNSSSISISFTLSANDNGNGKGNSQAQCQLDMAGYNACTSPVTFTALAEGQHTIYIKKGAESTIASYSFVVDRTPPSLLWVSTPSNITQSTTANFVFQTSEPSTYMCALDFAAPSSCDVNYSTPALSDGKHTVSVVATDAAGNASLPLLYQWVVDTTPPVLQITSVTPANSPTNSKSMSLTYTVNEPASVICELDGVAQSSCASPVQVSNLGEGSHELRFTATDVAGNVASDVVYDWTVDFIAPVLTLQQTSPATSPSNATSATFVMLSSKPSTTFQCSLDGAQASTCQSPVSYTGLFEGAHSIQVDGIDLAGNVSNTVTATWVIDLTPPMITLLSTYPTGSVLNTSSFSLQFEANENATFQCQLDAGGFAACQSPYVANELSDGPHILSIVATDLAGNSSQPTTYQWTVQTIATVSIDQVAPPQPITNMTTMQIFFSSPTASSFQCSLDNAAFSNCSSAVLYSSLPDGLHTFQVEALNGAGTPGPMQSYSWTIDTVPPQVTYTVAPSNPVTNSTSLTVTLSSNKAVAFSCSVDGVPAAGCSSPWQISGLKDGSHSFTVSAVDAAGNVGKAAPYNWTVDTVAPTLTLVGVDPVQALTNRTDLTASFSTSKTASLLCALDDGAAATCSSPVKITGLTNGAHTLQVMAIDSAGNMSQPVVYQWTVDTVPPVLQILSQTPASGVPSSNNTASFTFTANKQVTFTCSVDGVPGISCNSPFSTTVSGDGTHTFTLSAVDLAGNNGAPVSTTWILDTTPPVVTITRTPSGSLVNKNYAFVQLTANENATFFCSLDGAPVAACGSSLSFSGLNDGSHTLSVTAKDVAGNISNPVTDTWTVDTIPPTLLSLSRTPSQSPTNNRIATIAFSANEPSTFSCQLDGSLTPSCVSPVTLGSLADGTHTFTVTPVDLAGNIGASQTTSWVVDTVVPVVTLSITDPSSSPTNHTTFSAAFTSSKTNVTFTCSLDGASSTCASPFAATVADGSHAFSVFAVDQAGNQSSTSNYSWVVDTTPPVLTITSYLPANLLTNVTTFSASLSSNKPGFMNCSLDGSAFTVCSSPAFYPAIAAGSHTFSAYCVDLAGNNSKTVSVNWTVDLTAPVLTITSRYPSTSPTNKTSVNYNFTSTKTTNFTCSMDGVVTACTSPFTAVSLGNGTHNFILNGTDLAGNTASALFDSFVVDTVAPVLSWGTLSPSANPTNQNSISLAFNSTKTATFTCTVDGTSSSCVSPLALSGLPDGSHTVSITGADAAGNSSAPITYSWKIDTVKPVVSITFYSPSSSITNQTSLSVAFSVSKTAAAFCGVNGGSFAPCTSPFSQANVGTGTQSLSVYAIDAAGNQSSTVTQTWTVDRTAPVVSFTSYPASLTNSTSSAFTYSATKSVQFYCSLDGGAASACGSSISFSGLAAASHAFSIYGIDSAGNQSSTVTYTWSIDTTPPTIINFAATPSGSLTNVTSASFSFSASESASFSCSLDGASSSTCSSGITYTGLSNGSHTFSVYATDGAGNVSQTKTWNWTIDTTAPVVTLNSESPSWSPTAQTSLSISFSVSKSATEMCSIDGGAQVSCTSPFATPSLPDGTHTVSIVAHDAAGNVSAPASYTWTINTQPMTISSITVSQITQTTAVVSWTTSVPSTSQVLYWKGTTAFSTPVNSTYTTSHSVTLSGLTRFTLYTYEVTSTDMDGRTVTSGSASFRTSN